MATLAKIEANRRNAKRSTGPKTVSGKVASSKNAMRHGLLSREIVLPDESAEDFARFSDRLATHFGAQGAVEQLLVDRIGISAWRLGRAGLGEAIIRDVGQPVQSLDACAIGHNHEASRGAGKIKASASVRNLLKG